MANHRQANVQFVDTTANFPDIKGVNAVKYIGAAASTAKIVADADASGDDLWEENSTENEFDHVVIRNSKGIRVEITGSAKVYLYI